MNGSKECCMSCHLFINKKELSFGEKKSNCRCMVLYLSGWAVRGVGGGGGEQTGLLRERELRTQNVLL